MIKNASCQCPTKYSAKLWRCNAVAGGGGGGDGGDARVSPHFKAVAGGPLPTVHRRRQRQQRQQPTLPSQATRLKVQGGQGEAGQADRRGVKGEVHHIQLFAAGRSGDKWGGRGRRVGWAGSRPAAVAGATARAQLLRLAAQHRNRRFQQRPGGQAHTCPQRGGGGGGGGRRRALIVCPAHLSSLLMKVM